MKNLTLKQFRYFEALARFGHFGRAAAASGISQPALSMQIRELEQTLGADLFERSARLIRPTRFGEEFALRVQDILRSVDELADLARASRDCFAGRLSIGVIPTIAPYLLPRMIGAVADKYPDLDLHVRESVTPNLLSELMDGRLDVALLALPASQPTLTETPLFDEPFMLVRSEDHAGQPIPSAEDLCHMRLLLLEEGHCFRDQALSFCNIQTTAPRDGLDGSSLSTLVQMVAAGMGVTLVPEMAVSVETRSSTVSVSRFQDPQPKRTIGMVWRKTNPLADQLTELAEVVRGLRIP